MELTEFNIIVRPVEGFEWFVSCPALGTATGSGDTVFEAIEDWKNRLIEVAANEFVRDRMKSK